MMVGWNKQQTTSNKQLTTKQMTNDKKLIAWEKPE
jgi:hypothetical protein